MRTMETADANCKRARGPLPPTLAPAPAPLPPTAPGALRIHEGVAAVTRPLALAERGRADAGRLPLRTALPLWLCNSTGNNVREETQHHDG